MTVKTGSAYKARIHQADDIDLHAILTIIRASFAYMEERIDPPSSMHRLSLSNIQEHCTTGEVWSMGEPIHACMVLTPQSDALYLGRLSIDQKYQRCGLGTAMIAHAVDRARAHGKAFVELKTRIELTENHRFFEAQGFHIESEHCHDGFDRPTYIVMRRAL